MAYCVDTLGPLADITYMQDNNSNRFSTQLVKTLTRYAQSDMAKARKSEGGITITGTLLGNLDLTYRDGVYTLSNSNTGLLVAQGGAKTVGSMIVDAFDVKMTKADEVCDKAKKMTEIGIELFVYQVGPEEFDTHNHTSTKGVLVGHFINGKSVK